MLRAGEAGSEDRPVGVGNGGAGGKAWGKIEGWAEAGGRSGRGIGSMLPPSELLGPV